MKKVNLLAVIVMLIGLGCVTNVNANPYSPVSNANSIKTQISTDGGIVDPDDEDDDDEDGDAVLREG